MLVKILRQAARQINAGAPYQWGHMGSCNCGHLAQAITGRSKSDIHTQAMTRYGDWEQQLRDYCPQSGLPLDEIIDEMLALGLTRRDLAYLEKLTDPAILRALPPNHRHLKHNLRNEVVRYLAAWADLLERELLEQVDLSDLKPAKTSDNLMALT